MKRFLIAAALFSAMATHVQAVENGQCVSIEEANAMLQANGDELVAQAQVPGLLLFLVQRKDGTFKEVAVDGFGNVCHRQDFVGDPRLQKMAL